MIYVKNKLLNKTSYGGYDLQTDEFVILQKKTPKPWVNICANQDFGTLITESGEMFTWYKNSYLFRITPRIDDAVYRNGGEKLYLKDIDTGSIWQPLKDGLTKHGLGYSTFESNKEGLGINICILVPIDGSEKLIRLILSNNSRKVKNINTAYYNQLLLGDDLEKMSKFIKVSFDREKSLIKATNSGHPDFPEKIFYLKMSTDNVTFELDRINFFGTDNPIEPESLKIGMTRVEKKDITDPCAVLSSTVSIAPGKTKELFFSLGIAEDESSLKKKISASEFENELNKTKRYWQKINSKITIDTPNKELNVLFNRRLIYQILVSRLFARTGFYQAGGAYGYRDQLQDVNSLTYTLPHLAREHILTAASRQFHSGSVQHWWHPPGNAGVSSRSSDAHLWLVYATMKYVETTGDYSILEEKVPFLENAAHESIGSYYSPKVSEDKKTLYEHCLCSIERSLFLMGQNGLPLILSGDWNDSFDLVGKDKKGESVWLAMFISFLLDNFETLSRGKDQNTIEKYKKTSKKFKQKIEETCWDGDWYIRAFWDSGEKLGSKDNDECRIDSLTQSWAAIAGLDKKRILRSLKSAQEILVDKTSGTVKLFTPPFEKSLYDPGYVIKYPPGVRENGGAYTHAAAWLAKANAIVGNSAQAMEIIDLLNPLAKTKTDKQISRYQGEPYAMAADICTQGEFAGRAGWTWYTGSASVLYQVILEDLLGIKIKDNILEIKPSIPPQWTGFKLIYTYGKTEYTILFDNNRKSEKKLSFDLVDDGQKHIIRVH